MFTLNEPSTLYSYNDVTIWPRNSENRHVDEADLNFCYDIGLGKQSSPPLINAPMDTVCSPDLIRYLHNDLGMFVTVHRAFKSASDQIDFLSRCLLSCDGHSSPGISSYLFNRVFMSVGSLQKHKDWIDELLCVRFYSGCAYGINFLVDMANGDTKTCIETVEYIAEKSDAVIMAGNVATKSGYERLAKAGAKFIRVGIGGGAICTTRVNTGFGIPTLHSIGCIAPTKCPGTYLVADGGIESPGDICKAMAAGADMVMLGNMLCSTDLSGGRKFTDTGLAKDGDEIKWVEYKGMASKDVGAVLSQNRRHSVEGVSGLVRYRGKTREYLPQVLENLKAAMVYYGGVTNWTDFYRLTKFGRFDNQGWAESQPRVHAYNVLDRSVDSNQQG